jgi:hypothetical protein
MAEMIKTKVDRRARPTKSPSRQGEKVNTKPAAEKKGGRGRPKGPDLRMLSLGLAPALIERIDKWRFGQEIGTRSDAIRALVEKGLEP